MDSPPRFKLTRMFCFRPLLAIILAASLGLLSDRDPNPIGLIASLARFRRAQAQS
jgi:hypothetical protein